MHGLRTLGKKLLVETQSVQAQLLEAEAVGGDKKFLHFIAEISRTDVKNRNGRVYRRPIVEREIERFQKRIEERKGTGEVDHPDKVPSLSRNGVLWERVWIEPDGRVMGQAKVIETAVGKDLRANLEAGVSVGVSSRSRGTVTLGEWKGEQAEIVNDDLELSTFDVVSDPSVATAVSERTFVEQTKESAMPEEIVKDLAELKAKYPALHGKLIQEATAAVSSKFEPVLNQIVERKTGEIRKQVLAEMAEKGLNEADATRMRRSDAFVKTIVELLTKAEFIKEGAPADETTKAKLEALEAQVASLTEEKAKLEAALAEATDMLEATEEAKEVEAAITESLKGVPEVEATALRETLTDSIKTKEDIAKIPDVRKRFDTLVESLVKTKPKGVGFTRPAKVEEVAPIAKLNEDKKETVPPGISAMQRMAGL